MKIYAQTKQDGTFYYYTNISNKLENGDVKFKKIIINFKKGMETYGSITPREFTLSFNVVDVERKLKDKNTGAEVVVDVPTTFNKLMIWDYEITQRDCETNDTMEKNGNSYVKPYVSPEEKAAKQKAMQENKETVTNDNTNTLLGQNDGILPF